MGIEFEKYSFFQFYLQLSFHVSPVYIKPMGLVILPTLVILVFYLNIYSLSFCVITYII